MFVQVVYQSKLRATMDEGCDYLYRILSTCTSGARRLCFSILRECFLLNSLLYHSHTPPYHTAVCPGSLSVRITDYILHRLAASLLYLHFLIVRTPLSSLIYTTPRDAWNIIVFPLQPALVRRTYILSLNNSPLF